MSAAREQRKRMPGLKIKSDHWGQKYLAPNQGHPPTRRMSSEQDEWEVASLRDHRETKPGYVEYLVRWVGYEADDDTWEPRGNLPGRLAEAYEKVFPPEP